MALTAGEIAARAERFRELHRPGQPLVLPNPWDVGTARILAGLGFQALATTSAGLAFAFGRRDGVGAVSREEAIAHAAAIVGATALPVSADLENGYADEPDGVAESVLEAAAVGLVGCTIEDTCPGKPGFYPFDLAVARIKAAAIAARSLPFPFMLTARADGLIEGLYDLDEAIRRLQAYESVGAPVVYAPFLKSLDDIARVCASVKVPVNHLGGLGVPGETVASLAAAGVRRISLGGSLARVALGAAWKAGKEIAESGTFAEVASAPGWKPILEAIQAGKLH